MTNLAHLPPEALPDAALPEAAPRLREIPYNYTSFSDREIVIRLLGEDMSYFPQVESRIWREFPVQTGGR